MPEAVDDWFLREWMAEAGYTKQADLIRELGWEKSRAHFMWHNKQAYRREDVNAVAAWLNIAPHELLMHPREALAIRRLRETAIQIASDPELRAAETAARWDATPPDQRTKRVREGDK